MRVILALCLALVCGEAFGSIQIDDIYRSVGSQSEAGVAVDSDSIGGTLGILPFTRSSLATNGISSASGEASQSFGYGSGATYYGGRQNAFYWEAISTAQTQGADSSSYAQSATQLTFTLNAQTSVSLLYTATNQLGDFQLINTANSSVIADINNAANDWVLDPGNYILRGSWRAESSDGSPLSSSIGSMVLGVDGDIYFPMPAVVPEASSVAVWSTITVLGLFRLAGR